MQPRSDGIYSNYKQYNESIDLLFHWMSPLHSYKPDGHCISLPLISMWVEMTTQLDLIQNAIQEYCTPYNTYRVAKDGLSKPDPSAL